jgi:hypothetical protein
MSKIQNPSDLEYEELVLVYVIVVNLTYQSHSSDDKSKKVEMNKYIRKRKHKLPVHSQNKE